MGDVILAATSATERRGRCAHQLTGFDALGSGGLVGRNDDQRSALGDGRPHHHARAVDPEATAQVQDETADVVGVAGRVVFIPGDARQWRLKAFSADGHGVDLRFASPAAQGNAAVAIDAGVGPSRTALALLGLGLILALFGAYQLFGKRRP